MLVRLWKIQRIFSLLPRILEVHMQLHCLHKCLAALLDCLATHQCYLHSFLIFLIIIHSLISNCIAHVAHKYYILKLKVSVG